MAYATVEDVQARMTRTMSADEQAVCSSLLDDAAALIDSYRSQAKVEVKKIVSCRMVVRAIGAGNQTSGVPIGASQGSMAALGYSQSWTMGANASVGELYLGKTDKALLGGGNKIGSHSPIEDKRKVDIWSAWR